MKPIIVGELDSCATDSVLVLYPEPRYTPGWRLCHLILGLRREDYVEQFDRRNLLTGTKWSTKKAQAAADQLWLESEGAPLILLGGLVARAFGVSERLFDVTLRSSGQPIIVLPHPSKLCREWQVEGAYKRAQMLLCASGVLT